MGAGFADITIDAVEHRSRAPSPREPAIAYCQGTPLRSEIEARGAPGLQAATERAAEALAKRFGSGAIDGKIRALVISAGRLRPRGRPNFSQPKSKRFRLCLRNARACRPIPAFQVEP